MFEIVPSARFEIAGITWIPNNHEPGGY